jgi:hypothetical protein
VDDIFVRLVFFVGLAVGRGCSPAAQVRQAIVESKKVVVMYDDLGSSVAEVVDVASELSSG